MTAKANPLEPRLMKQKIEWYREVLELEPGSRVFFPLARLLAEDGQIAEAVSTLRQGSLRHPDHIEARLLLVELLSAQDASSDMRVEVEKLGALLGAYPGFWSAWEGQLASNPSTRDAALALRFFAAVLQGASLDWASVIEHGLKAVFAGASRPLSAPAAVRTDAAAPFALSPPVAGSAADDARETEDMPGKAPEAVSFASSFAAPDKNAPAGAFADPADDEESDEPFSLRTRSMAEVLAEQGDTAGALDIYHELMRGASAEEMPGLRARADELAGRMQQVQPAGAEDKTAASGGESSRLVNLLESLAQRLEARAR